jgi:hypothetical protein
MLLSVTASIPIQAFLSARLGIELDQFLIVTILCGSLVIGFLLFGLFLERKLEYWQNLMSVQNSKNPQITEILSNTRDILRRQQHDERI